MSVLVVYFRFDIEIIEFHTRIEYFFLSAYYNRKELQNQADVANIFNHQWIAQMMF